MEPGLAREDTQLVFLAARLDSVFSTAKIEGPQYYNDNTRWRKSSSGFEVDHILNAFYFVLPPWCVKPLKSVLNLNMDSTYSSIYENYS